MFAPLLISGCSAGPNYHPQSAASLGIPSHWSASAEPGAEDLALWWNKFEDPQLARYVDRALNANLDIVQAAARLRQARAALVQARAGYAPSIGATAGTREGYDFGDNVIGSRSTTSYSADVDASWSMDLFGGTSRAVEASRAELEAAGYDLASVRTAIAAEVALNYIDARSAQASLAIARDTLATQDDNLQIAQWRRQAGLVSSLDVEQARTQRAQTAATIPTLETSFASAANRIAVLMGDAPGTITADLASNATIPQGPDGIAAGIPADTLRQRPDVRAAERTLAAATARIGVAKARLYPSLAINGNIGASALSVGGLADAITGSLFGSLSQLLFDGGATAAAVRSQEAGADAAFAAYRQTVLTALEDVENALVSFKATNERREQLVIALDAAETTALLARSQYQSGLTDFRTVLDAERSLLSARDGLSSIQAAHAQALVRLYLALGGGWDPLAPLPDGTDQ
ncbi:efflux transporter outer membrane subunit [Croceicoccus estronivorus]|uniref:efflux transporter outer membrane subunit n=1 Tax=Croceicoccus estronivorus TaxID=1172626 RepID=UPI002E25F385